MNKPHKKITIDPHRNAKILLLLINIATLVLFLSSYFTYKTREEIINSNEDIKEYEVTKYYCWGGTRGGSTVYIIYNSKEYIVGISYPSCEALKNKTREVKFYYNEKSDKVFTPSGLNIKMVILFGFVFVFFMSFWLVPNKYW